MSSKRDSHLSQDSDALLPGKGHSPSYGINESSDLTTSSLGSSGKTAPSIIQSIVHPGKGERVWVVAMCSLVACLAAMINGIMIGYSSPTLSILTNKTIQPPNEYFEDGQIESSLFAAFGAVGAIFGGPIAWPLSEKFGRQAALMLSGLPSVIGWVLIANAHSCDTKVAFVVVLLIGRFLTGLATGWSIFGISVYISEIASAKLKGLFGNCNQLFITIGVLIASVFGIRFNGSPVPYWAVALGAAGLVVVFEVLMLFTYETPRWLFSKGREHEGIHVLKILRGPNAKIAKEIDRTRHALRRTYSVAEQFQEFKKRSVYLPFVIVLFLMFFQQFSGINAAVFYAVPILSKMRFDDQQANIIATAAVGITQVVATFIAVILVDFLGRRILLLVSGAGMAISSFMFFAFFVVLDRTCAGCFDVSNTTTNSNHNCSGYNHYPCNTSSLGYLGIVAMVVFIASFSLAWGPIPWSMMSELLPNRVRTLAASIATFVNWTFASIITVAFQYYAKAITSEFAFLTFAVMMVGSIVFVFLFVPETKGHSLEEIQDHFEKGEIFAFSCFRRSPNNIEKDHPSRVTVTSVSGYNGE